MPFCVCLAQHGNGEQVRVALVERGACQCEAETPLRAECRLLAIPVSVRHEKHGARSGHAKVVVYAYFDQALEGGRARRDLHGAPDRHAARRVDQRDGVAHENRQVGAQVVVERNLICAARDTLGSITRAECACRDADANQVLAAATALPRSTVGVANVADGSSAGDVYGEAAASERKTSR